MGKLSKAAVRWAKAEKVYHRHKARLRRRAGVVSVDLGLKIVRGKLTRIPSLRIHVEQKRQARALSDSQRFPKSIEGIEVDVIEGTYRFLECPDETQVLREYQDELVGGIGIGLRGRNGFGTLAALCRKADDSLYGLTVGHLFGFAGGEVVQPAFSTDGCGAVDSFLLNPNSEAALFSVDRDVLPGLYGGFPMSASPLEVDSSFIGRKVKFIGACSGLSVGVIDSIHFPIDLWFQGRLLRFRNQIHIMRHPDLDEFSRPGDSGALVLDYQTGRPVGLLFAGEGEGGTDFGVACPIVPVLEGLGVEFF